MAYAIEIARHVVSYRAEPCEIIDVDHECTGECTWMDGDSRVIEVPEHDTITPDEYDLEWHDGSPVKWAADYIRTKTDASEASMYPIPDAVREHDWLSGSYQDPYQGDSHVTETTVRLTGDWTDQERAEVFRAVTQH